MRASKAILFNVRVQTRLAVFCKPKIAARTLVSDIDQLIVDTDGTYQLSKELIARAIEDLLQEDPLPKLLYHTIERVYSNVPALKGFLINVLKKTAQTHEDPKLEDLIQTLPTGA